MTAEEGELVATSGFDEHRTLVREADRSFSQVYGFGGAAVLGAGLIVVVLAWMLGTLWAVSTLVFAVTVSLIGLFVLRSFVQRKRSQLRQRVESYCQLNEIEVDHVRELARDEGIYPYFEALFEEPKR